MMEELRALPIRVFLIEGALFAAGVLLLHTGFRPVVPRTNQREIRLRPFFRWAGVVAFTLIFVRLAIVFLESTKDYPG